MCGALAASSATVIAPQEVLSVIVYLAAVSMVSFGSALNVRVAAASSGFLAPQAVVVMPALGVGVAVCGRRSGVARLGCR